MDAFWGKWNSWIAPDWFWDFFTPKETSIFDSVWQKLSWFGSVLATGYIAVWEWCRDGIQRILG